MKKFLCLLVFVLSGVLLYAHIDPKPLANQEELLKSADKKLAANKKIVYDFWREVLEARHLDLCEKYMKTDYMQHNPNAATGRKAVVEFFSKFSKPQPIVDSIKAPVVAIIAEGNLVMLSFVRELPDPSDKSKKYTTTWFDLFRIENGKIAEHWDGAEKMKLN